MCRTASCVHVVDAHMNAYLKVLYDSNPASHEVSSMPCIMDTFSTKLVALPGKLYLKRINLIGNQQIKNERLVHEARRVVVRQMWRSGA